MLIHKFVKLNVILWALLISPVNIAANKVATNKAATKSVNKAAATKVTVLNFQSEKPWQAARWYAIGRWIHPNGIQWLGANTITNVNLPAECFETSNPTIHIAERIGGNSASETLSFNEWIALELSPAVANEELNIKTSKSSQHPHCQTKTHVAYKWSAKDGAIAPLLMLSPQGSQFYKHEINITPKASTTSESTDIQMEFFAGIWRTTLGNASEGAKQNLLLSPTTIARGEWLPQKKHWGLKLELEQTVASFAGAEGQKATFSDWQVAAFGEAYLLSWNFFDAIQFRGGFGYRQHLADDSNAVPSLLTANKDARYLILSGAINIYSELWIYGVDFDYGPPSTMAKRGVTQSYWNTRGRIGYRTSSILMLMLEGGLRSYKTKDFADEQLMALQMGIRLEL